MCVDILKDLFKLLLLDILNYPFTPIISVYQTEKGNFY
jgi:hypothetical protein